MIMGMRNWLARRRLAGRLRKLAAEGQAFYKRGMYRESIRSGGRARALIAAHAGTANSDYAFATRALADLHSTIGDHANAAALNREAFEIFVRTLPANHDLIGHTLGQLAKSYEALGNFDAAILPLEQLKQWMILAKGTNDPGTVQVMTSAAFLHLYLGRRDLAFGALNEVLEIARDLTGPVSRDYAMALHNVAFAHLFSGNYSKARELLNTCSRIAEQATRGGVPGREFAVIQSTLGQLYDALDDHAGAEQAYTRGLAMLGDVTNETREQAIALLNNLAGVYRNTHQEQLSETTYVKALQLLDAAGSSPDSASRKWTKATLQTNLSQLYRWAGRFEEAETLARQAMALTAGATGTRSPEFANRLHNLGLILGDRGTTGEAEKVLREALALRESLEGELGPGYGAALNVLASLFVRTNRQAEAAALMRKELEIDDRRMWAVLAASSERQRLAHLDRLRRNTFGYLSFVLGQRETSPALVQEGFDVAVRRKAASLEVLASERLAALSSDDDQVRRDLAALREVQTQLASAELGPPRIETAIIAEWIQRREQLEAALAQRLPELALDLRLRNVNSKVLRDALPPGSALIEYVRFEPFDFATLPKREGSRWRPARYLAFVLRSDSPQVSLVDLGDAARIDEQVVQWRNRLTGKPAMSRRDVRTDPASAEGGAEAAQLRDLVDELELFARDLVGPRLDPQPAHHEGRLLRESIFDPVRGALDGLPRLFIAPDGELSGVPFEALPSDNERFVIDDYVISYLTVGRDILRFGAGHSEAGRMPVVAADPAFDLGTVDDDERRGPFVRLPGARAEGREIAQLLGVEPWLDDMVADSRLKTIRSPAILHLATHGFFFPNSAVNRGDEDGAPDVTRAANDDRLAYLKNARSPLLRCGLALAGANTWVRGGQTPESAEDGLLMAQEVVHLNLLGTELVTLSACETGLGDAHVGESIFGLRRAFVVAGAKTLVMSLWKVPDAATRSLMTDMYSQLVSRKPRADALRLAQLNLKKQYPTEPFYWGAFICQGDPHPLEWKAPIASL